MATDWQLKELLTADKQNQLGVPKYSVAEEIVILDSRRLAGMINFNTDNKKLQIYQSGNGATFDKTELSNFLFRDDTNIGITTPQQKVYEPSFVNTEGKMNSRVFITLRYLQETSIAGEIKVTLDHSGTNIVNTDTLSSNGSPTLQEITYELDSSTIALDDLVSIWVEILQVQIQYIEIRSI